MLIYEKNNKLNINFDPSKSIEGTPDIQIGENEIKLGDAEITSENVLPTPTNEDVGKIVSVGEGGSYELVPFQEPTGTIEITENGIVDVADYASANVQVPNPSTGGISITENGTYDVTEKASAVVNVPATVKFGSIKVNNASSAMIQFKFGAFEVVDGELRHASNDYLLISAGESKNINVPYADAQHKLNTYIDVGFWSSSTKTIVATAVSADTYVNIASQYVSNNTWKEAVIRINTGKSNIIPEINLSLTE